MVLHSFFMAYWNGAGYGGIAVPCPANINKTLKRRPQRKHTQQSYRQMKEKLLSLLKPMPIAASAADLEQFRLKIYANSDDDLSTREPDCNRCQWCGIWMPLPNAGIITTEVREASSTSVAEPVEDSCTIITTVVKEATPEPDPLTGQLEKVGKAVDELLELSLCQATFGQSSALDKAPRPLREHAELQENSASSRPIIYEDLACRRHPAELCKSPPLDKGRSLWTTGPGSIFAADACSPSGEQRIHSFMRTRANLAEVPEAPPNSDSVSSSPVPSQLYSTDESTGECKSQ